MFDTACDRNNNETVTVRKHVTKYKIMRKQMVEILRNFESHGDKMARLYWTEARINSIRITKSINLLWFLYGVGIGCHRGRYSVHSPLINNKTYICLNLMTFQYKVKTGSWKGIDIGGVKIFYSSKIIAWTGDSWKSHHLTEHHGYGRNAFSCGLLHLIGAS